MKVIKKKAALARRVENSGRRNKIRGKGEREKSKKLYL